MRELVGQCLGGDIVSVVTEGPHALFGLSLVEEEGPVTFVPHCDVVWSRPDHVVLLVSRVVQLHPCRGQVACLGGVL